MAAVEYEVAAGESLRVHRDFFFGLAPQERRAVGALFKEVDQSGAMVLLRARAKRAGVVTVPGATFRVRSQVSPKLLLQMLVFSLRLDVERFLERQPTTAPVERTRRDDLLPLLCALMARLSENILRTHVVQRYVAREDRLTTLRGRVQWSASFGRHWSAGIPCRYFEKSTDNRLNQIVVSALDRATMLAQDDAVLARAILTQSHIWRDLASPRVLSERELDEALTGLDRHSVAYENALHVARLLLFGFRPIELYGAGSPLQSIWFDVPYIFERVVERLVTEALAVSSARVVAQQTQHRVLLDGYGDRYRAVRPDLIVYTDGKPSFIIDVKFKPGYVEGVKGRPQRFVSSADIYQLFFYSLRLAERYGLAAPVHTYIVAPVLRPDAGHTDPLLRTVRWHGKDDDLHAELVVFPIDVAAAIQAVNAGSSALAALQEHAPELARELDRNRDREA